MNRFWIFPITLAIVGAFLPVIALYESAVPMAIGTSSIPVSAHLVLLMAGWIPTWIMTYPYGAVSGLAIGISMALFDWSRNGYRSAFANGLLARLILNLWWCGVYVEIIIALNSVLIWLVFKTFDLPLQSAFVRLSPLLLTATLRLSAMMWASIRTITTTDVLSPSMLGSKLNHSAHIQG